MCSGRAECEASDCEASRVVRLGTDGSHLSGFATLSPSTRSVAVVGEISQGTYKVEGDRIHFEPSSGRSYSSTVECSDARLVLNNVVKIRAEEWLATALDGNLGISPSSPDEQGGG
jgi:hypothetical protein